MAKTKPLRIDLKGPRGHAELSDFVNVVSALRLSLKHACRCIAGTDEVECDVVGLNHASAHLSAMPIPNGVPQAVLADVAESLDRTISALESGGEPDPRFDYLALRAIGGFASAVKKPQSHLAVCGTQLTMAFVTRVQSLLEPDRFSAGSVTGRLEGLNIHGDNVFTLYPPIPGEEVNCVFAKADMQHVLAAVDHNVTVYGTLYYAKAKAFPVRVEVDTFEVMPETDSLPTLLNACGSMHSDVSSVDMIRESRNGW